MKRAAKILGWTAGIFLGLLLIAAGTIYFVATSDYLRGQLEGRASDLTGRKTQIAKVAVQWGWTSNVKLEGIEVANAKWGKAPYMLKVDQVDFDIRLWPLLGGNLVLPRLVLRKPEIQVEEGRQGAAQLEHGRDAGCHGCGQGARTRQPPRRAGDRQA